MALGIDEANTVSDKFYDKTITQQVYEKSPLFYKLKQEKKVRWDGGTQIQFAIRYNTLDSAINVNPREQIEFGQKETRTGGVLDYKFTVEDAMISWDERVKNTGKPQIINLLREKTDELQQDMFNKFQSDLYNTTQSSKAFSGLDEIVDAGDSYAGIAVADASEWAAIENTSATELYLYGDSTSLSHQINLATFGPDKPDLIVTSRDLYNKAESLIQPQERFEDTMMADAGFTTVKFHGIPIVGDYALDASTAGSGTYMYGLCCKYFEFRCHPDYDFKTTPWKELFQAGYINAMAKAVSWAGNIVCKMRKVNFKYTALDYTN